MTSYPNLQPADNAYWEFTGQAGPASYFIRPTGARGRRAWEAFIGLGSNETPAGFPVAFYAASLGEIAQRLEELDARARRTPDDLLAAAKRALVVLEGFAQIRRPGDPLEELERAIAAAERAAKREEA
jgi:hypothetical protein